LDELDKLRRELTQKVKDQAVHLMPHDSLHNEVLALQAENENLKAQLFKVPTNTPVKSVPKDIESRIRNYEDQISELEQELRDTAFSKRELQSQLDEIRKAGSEGGGNLEQILADKVFVENELGRANEQIANLEEEKAELEKKYKGEIDRLKKEIEKLKEEGKGLETVRHDKAEIENELELAKQMKKNIEEEIEKIKKESFKGDSDLKMKLANAESEAKNNKLKYENEKKEKEELKMTLEGKIHELESQLKGTIYQYLLNS
jgi:chromosome segregation ATPase